MMVEKIDFLGGRTLVRKYVPRNAAGTVNHKAIIEQHLKGKSTAIISRNLNYHKSVVHNCVKRFEAGYDKYNFE